MCKNRIMKILVAVFFVGSPFLLAITASWKLPSLSQRTLRVTSMDMADGQKLPVRHTCDGQNISPHIAWSGITRSTKCASLAVICEDPDSVGHVWAHWIVFNIPPTTKSLERAMPKSATLTSGIRQGKNDFGKIGYGGACPPRGHGVHRFVFRVYALDKMLKLPAGIATYTDIMREIKTHIVAQGWLVTTYSR